MRENCVWVCEVSIRYAKKICGSGFSSRPSNNKIVHRGVGAAVYARKSAASAAPARAAKPPAEAESGAAPLPGSVGTGVPALLLTVTLTGIVALPLTERLVETLSVAVPVAVEERVTLTGTPMVAEPLVEKDVETETDGTTVDVGWSTVVSVVVIGTGIVTGTVAEPLVEKEVESEVEVTVTTDVTADPPLVAVLALPALPVAARTQTLDLTA